MIYLQTVYSRRDPISVGLQNAFPPSFDLTDDMASALRRLDAKERRVRLARTMPARARLTPVAAAC